MTKESVLQSCTVEGNIVRLPGVQLERKVYTDVAKALELIGGKWKGGKIMGFVFPSDPTNLLNEVAKGEKRNLKKEFQFFATPAGLADKLVSLAEINSDSIILEPSAGQGAIVNAIHRAVPSAVVNCCELMDVNQVFLKEIEKANLICEDFMNLSVDEKYDKIIANPPFSKNQDIDHINKMYQHLSVGGRLISIASKHWQLSDNKKETEFRQWLENVGAETHEIPAGEFKESGTSIPTVIIVIEK